MTAAALDGKLRVAAAVSSLIVGAAADPANATSITLEEVLRGTLRPDRIATLVQDENVKAAAGKIQEAKGAFDWNVNTQGGWQRLFTAKAVNGVLTNQTQQVNSFYYSANVGRKFRNGIEIDPGVTAYPVVGATPAQTAGLTQLRPSLGLKIPIVRGFGEESADALERSAKDSFYGARQSRVFAIAQIVQNDVSTFWRCLADDEIAQIAQNADRNAADYQDSLNKMLQRGLVEPTVAQQSAANNVVQHLTAQQAKDTALVCRRDLAYATTGSVSGPYPALSGELPEMEPMAGAINRLNADELFKLALSRRQDLKAAESNVEATVENLRNAEDNTSPQLNLHIDPLSAIVSYTQSIQNNTAEGLQAQASAAKAQADLTLRQLQDQIHMDVSDAVRNLQRTVSDWSALKLAQHQMEGVVADANKRARYGSITWSDFLTAENELAQIEQQAVNTQLQFALGLANLRFVTGTIEPDTETPAGIAAKLTTLPGA